MKRFLLLLSLAILTIFLVGCQGGEPEPAAEEATVREVIYRSESGDTLTVRDDNTFSVYVLALDRTLRGTVSGKGKALILTTETDVLYVSLDGDVFSFVNMPSPATDEDPTTPLYCDHEETAVRGAQDATCTLAGYSGDKYCVLCGKVLRAGRVIPAKNHDYTVESDVVCQKAVCIRPETRFYACSRCGEIGTETYEVPNTVQDPPVHSYTAVSDRVFSEADCGHNRVCYAACSVCQTVSPVVTLEVPDTMTNKHDFTAPSTKYYQEPDCGHNAVYYYACSVCGIISINPNDTYEVSGTTTGVHDYSLPSGMVKQAATCLSDRVEFARCRICGMVDERYEITVPGTATGVHIYTAMSDEVARRATCTTDEYVYSMCVYCGKVSRERTLRVMNTATDHTYFNRVCEDCGLPETGAYRTYDVSMNANADNVTAYLYRNGGTFDLLIYGVGKMRSFYDFDQTPWADSRHLVANVFVYDLPETDGIEFLGDYAFADMSTLSSVVVHSQVKKIGNYAFYRDTDLTDLSLPTSLRTIGQGAFAACTGLTAIDLSSLTSLSAIGTGAFRDNPSLTQIKLNGTALTKLSDSLLCDCYRLTSVTLPSTVEEIGAYALYRTSLTTFTPPAALTSVGAYALAECTYLTELDFSATNLCDVGDYAFSGNTVLADLTLGAQVTHIGKNIMEGTAYAGDNASYSAGMLYSDSQKYLLAAASKPFYLQVSPSPGDNPAEKVWYKRFSTGYFRSTDIYGKGGKTYYEYTAETERYDMVESHPSDDPSALGWYELSYEYRLAEEAVLGSSAYYRLQSSLSGVVAPYSGAVIIADEAFIDCTDVNMVSLGAALTHIGNDAFRHCISLTSVVFGSNLLSIGDGAFYSCVKLVSAELPSGVLSVGDNAFASCLSLRSFSFRSGATMSDSVLAGVQLFEIYRPDASYPSFGAGVVHTDDYSAPSVVGVDNDYVFAYADGQGYLIGTLNTAATSAVLPDTFLFNGATITTYRIADYAFCQDVFYLRRSAGETITDEEERAARDVVYSQLVSVVIPSSVTAIGKGAFYGCGYLASVTATDSIVEIGADAFTGTAFATDVKYRENGFLYLKTTTDNYLLIDAQSVNGNTVTDAVVKDKTILIADKAFALCPQLKTASIPSTVAIVGYDVFTACTQLTTLTVPFIGRKASEENYVAYYFGGTSYVDNASLLPSSFANLTVSQASVMPAHVLDSCAYLKRINLQSATSYGEYALNDCVAAQITLTLNVVALGEGSFKNCLGLESVILSETLTEVPKQAFFHTGLKKISFESTAVSIVEEEAFATSPYLYMVTFGEAMEHVRKKAFYDCIGLLIVKVGQNMNDVDSGEARFGSDCFYGCKKLVEVQNRSSTLPVDIGSTGNGYLAYYARNVYTLRSGASIITDDTSDPFKWMTLNQEHYLLANVDPSDTITCPSKSFSYSLYPYAFARNSVLTTINFSANVTAIGDYAFWQCSQLTTVSFGGSETTINPYAFSSSGLTSITIPIALTTIGESAFENCLKLTRLSFAIGNQVVIVGGQEQRVIINERAFYGCTALTDVTLPLALLRVGASAFYGCSSVGTLSIAKNVTYIGNYAFAEMSDLYQVQWGCSPALNANSKLFENSGRGGEGIRVVFTSTVTQVPGYLFYTDNGTKTPKVTSLSIGSTIEKIEQYAFYGLPIASVDLPSSLLAVDRYAFYGSGLQTLTLPSSVTTLGVAAFSACYSLTRLTLSENLTSIAADAFSECSALGSLILPASVTSIGSNAFSDCLSLSNVVLYKDTEISAYAFSGCSSLEYVYIYGTPVLESENEPTVHNDGDGNAYYVAAAKRYVYFEATSYQVDVRDDNNINTLLFYEADRMTPFNPAGVTYASENVNIVEVTYTGKIKGHSYGTTTITATISLAVTGNLTIKLSYSATVR